MSFDTDGKPLVLCLGLSYPCVEANISRHFQREKKATDVNLTSDTGAEPHCDARQQVLQTATALVRSRILTEMDGRDLVRCRMVETCCGVDVITVSLEAAALYRRDRHLDADFNSRRFVSQLRRLVGNRCFYQVVLDYFWIPSAWNERHWRRYFFDRVLVELATSGLLCEKERPSTASTNRYGRGAIYLPFCLHCFQEVVSLSDKLCKYFDVSFLRKGELDEIMLWSATQQIDQGVMQLVFGKQLDQEELYCKVTVPQLKAFSDDRYVTQRRLLDVAKSLEGISDIRFIALRVKQI